MNRKKIFLIIGGCVAIIIVALLIILFFSNQEFNSSGGTNDKKIKEDIKKDDELGKVLTNLNSNFKLEKKEKTKNFTYEFTLNNERKILKFKNVILNNDKSPAKIDMYIDNVQINIMDIVNNSIVRIPTSIIPVFYILGEKNDEVLLIEILTNDSLLTNKIYIAVNNDGEVRNSFGGLANNDVSQEEFLNAISKGKLIYDHRININESKDICNCEELKKGKALNIVLSEKRTFSVLKSSLIMDSSSEYKCSNYCK